MTRSINLSPETRYASGDRSRRDSDAGVCPRFHRLLFLDDGHTWATVASFQCSSSRTITLRDNRKRLDLRAQPTYSPECNPIERIWRHLHGQVTRNERWQSMQARLGLTFTRLCRCNPFKVEGQSVDRVTSRFTPSIKGSYLGVKSHGRFLIECSCPHGIAVGGQAGDRVSGVVAFLPHPCAVSGLAR